MTEKQLICVITQYSLIASPARYHYFIERMLSSSFSVDLPELEAGFLEAFYWTITRTFHVLAARYKHTSFHLLVGEDQ